MGTLKPGALDHGFVPAVAVTVWTLDSVTIPELSPPLIWTSPELALTTPRPAVVTGGNILELTGLPMT